MYSNDSTNSSLKAKYLDHTDRKCLLFEGFIFCHLPLPFKNSSFYGIILSLVLLHSRIQYYKDIGIWWSFYLHIYVFNTFIKSNRSFDNDQIFFTNTNVFDMLECIAHFLPQANGIFTLQTPFVNRSVLQWIGCALISWYLMTFIFFCEICSCSTFSYASLLVRIIVSL